MHYRVLADFVLVLHAAFVTFVVLGGFLALRWRRVAWLHLPAMAWGAAIELTGWICPLTPLEDWLRVAGGGTAASGDFIERAVGSVLYMPGLTRRHQFALGVALLLLNAGVYGFILYKSRLKQATGINVFRRGPDPPSKPAAAGERTDDDERH